MDLVVIAEKLEKEYAQKVAKLDARSAELSLRESEISARELKATEIYDELKVKSDDLTAREARVRRDDEIAILEKELQEKVSKLAKEMGELKAYENKLAAIHLSQQAKESTLSAREQRLSDDKASYKETLKAEFLETLKKQMPQ